MLGKIVPFDPAATGYEITLPHPPKALSQNARGHWSKRAAACRIYRALAWAEARLATGGHPPKWKKATVQIIWNSTTLRHPDPANIIGSLKCAFDGLQDAGLVVNDRGLYPERPEIRTKQPWNSVVLRVREETL